MAEGARHGPLPRPAAYLEEMPGRSYILSAAVAVSAVASGLGACSSSEGDVSHDAMPGLGSTRRRSPSAGSRRARRCRTTDEVQPSRSPPACSPTVRRPARPWTRRGAARADRTTARPSAGRPGIVMLHRKAAPARDVVSMLDARTLRPRCRFPLPKGSRYRAVATAQERVFAFGNRPGGDRRNSALYSFIEPGSGAWETRCRPQSGPGLVRPVGSCKRGRARRDPHLPRGGHDGR